MWDSIKWSCYQLCLLQGIEGVVGVIWVMPSSRWVGTGAAFLLFPYNRIS